MIHMYIKSSRVISEKKNIRRGQTSQNRISRIIFCSEFALQQLCQFRQDLNVYLPSPADGGCSALGHISEAGPPAAPGAWLFSEATAAEEFPFCFLWSWQWRNEVPGGLKHDEPAWPRSKLANLHPVEKIQAHPRPPGNMGWFLSIVWRGGPSTLPMDLHFVVPDESAFKLSITKTAYCKI